MPKSPVERYEQMLQQDPASTVFVELAKALLEKGDAARAIEVCQAGLTHHPASVVGRVLWGKALIHLGKPAEAMAQFDLAVAIEKDNPYAYNLIAEVLLQRGLYRSALPILRKASSLQPNNGRVKEWLEKAQAALSGGPAPSAELIVNPDSPLRPAEDGPPPEAGDAGPDEGEAHRASGEQQAPFVPEGQRPTGERSRVRASGERPAPGQTGEHARPGEPPEGTFGEQRPEAPFGEDLALPEISPASRNRPRPNKESGPRQIPVLRPGDAPKEIPVLSPAGTQAGPEGQGGRGGGQTGASGEHPAGGTRRASGEHPAGARRTTGEHPAGGGRAPSDEQAAGSPGVRTEHGAGAPRGSGEHTSRGSGRASGEHAAGGADTPDSAGRGNAGAGGDGEVPEGQRETGEHPSAAASAPDASDREADSGGLLGDLPPLEGTDGGGLLPEVPSPKGRPAPKAPPAEAPAPPPLRSSGEKRALLEEIPELLQSSASVELPKVELSHSTTQAIAEEYERELRQKLAANAEKKSFLTRHGVKVGVAAVLLAVIGVGAFAFISTRARNRGRDLGDALAEARKGISLDTAAGYRGALEALGIALQMDDDSPDAWAMTAYANALLYAEHGGGASFKGAAEAALARKELADGSPALGVAARYYVTPPQERDALRKTVLAANEDSSELNELAGRILLQKKESRAAVERFRRALELASSNVRALVALGNYYRDAGDHPNALKFFETAGAISPAHPERVIGAAESRLELDTALEVALAEVEKLPAPEELHPELLARRELVFGRLLTANGRAADALPRLAQGAKAFKGHAYGFQLALGEAAMAAGDYARAEEAFSEALQLRPGRDEAEEGLGRALLGRGEERALLARLRGDDRRVALVRGIAAARLKDWKRARAELSKTRISGKYPSEAVVYLALADAAEGDAARAEEVLEKMLAATKKAKTDAHVALGQLYLQKGDATRARRQFEAAEKDPLDYEGACSLGRLLLSQGQTQKAREALERAVRRNGSHGEARRELVRLYLAGGELIEGLRQAEAWNKDAPSDGEALRLLALAQHLNGKWRDADETSARLVRVASREPAAHRVRAQVLFSVGNARAAFKSLERANKLDPTDADTFCEIGHGFLRQGKPDNAAAAFGAAIKNRPESDCGAIGELLAKLPSGARGALRPLSERATRAAAAWDRGLAQAALARAHLVMGGLNSARKSAEAAVKAAPYLGEAHHSLGLVLLRQKDERGAVKALRQASELEPAHAGIRISYADALARAGDESEALKEYQTFLKLGGEDGDIRRAERVVNDLKKRLAAR